MRRRRVVFRLVTGGVLIVGAIALTIWGNGSIGAILVTLALYAIGLFQLMGAIGAMRRPADDLPPPGKWWICELPLPIEHRLVREELGEDAPVTYRCRWCGARRDAPPKHFIDSVTQAEAGWIRHDE